MSEKRPADARTLLRLFSEMFLLAASVVGGGYVILSVADARFSKKRGWIRPGELIGMLPVFQMIPGIIGGHTAVYLGRRVAGAPGAAAALFGMVLPSVLVFLGMALAYRSIPLDDGIVRALFLGLRAALVGILVDMVVRTGWRSVTDVFGNVTLFAAIAALAVARVAPAAVIVAGMAAGVAVEAVRARTRRAGDGTDGGRRVFRGFFVIPLLFLGYGLMAFGGGFVLVPLFLRDFVGSAAPYLQLAPGDFANVMALAEMTPGPVAANAATFFGFGLGGVAGALVATLALVVPGSVILYFVLGSLERFRESIVVRGILTGVRPVTTALLVSATWTFFGLSVWQATPSGGVFSPLGAALAAVSCALVATRCVSAALVIPLAAAVAATCAFAGVMIP